MLLDVFVKLIHTAPFDFFTLVKKCPALGGWVGQIKIKDHLSPAEAEVGPEIGKNPQHQ